METNKCVLSELPLKSTTSLEVLLFAKEMQLSIQYTSNERILGPRFGAPEPPDKTEICIKNLPRVLYENRILPFFMKFGKIYKSRLVLSPDRLTNKGIAYITFDTREAAKLATSLNKFEMYPGFKINVEVVAENRRIFVGGIPDYTKKEDVIQELTKAGFKNVVDVIMYQSYAELNKNRGFVFVEFLNHEEAKLAISKFKHVLLFGQRVHIDWSTPLPVIPDSEMNKVKKLFIRHISIYEDKNILIRVLKEAMDRYDEQVEKVYRFRDYAFIHFKTREDAEYALTYLKQYYENSSVEVSWAKPAANNQEDKENRRVSTYVENAENVVELCQNEFAAAARNDFFASSSNVQYFSQMQLYNMNRPSTQASPSFLYPNNNELYHSLSFEETKYVHLRHQGYPKN